jgi:hypothetical protein
MGWQGAINSRGAAEVSAVLPSFEDRFGVVLAGLAFATLSLLVPRPPLWWAAGRPVASRGTRGRWPDVGRE